MATSVRHDQARRLGGIRGRERGAASLEFSISVVLVLLPLIAAILELSQIAMARHALSFAVYDAARAASRDQAGEENIRLRLATGLAPLLGGISVTEQTSVLEVSTAIARAFADTIRPDRLTYSLDTEGVLLTRESVRRLRVTYCRELFFVPVKQFLPRVLLWGETNAFDFACLMQGRLPLKASAAIYIPRASTDSVRPEPPRESPQQPPPPSDRQYPPNRPPGSVVSALDRSDGVSISMDASGISTVLREDSLRSRWRAP